MKTENFKNLYDRADAAAKAAVEDLSVVPMHVRSGNTVYVVEDGPCGFAWVELKPANCGFAKWLRAEELAEKRYGGPGVSMWIGAYNQSYEKKRAYAGAFAKVLQGEGLNARSGSRMD